MKLVIQLQPLRTGTKYFSFLIKNAYTIVLYLDVYFFLIIICVIIKYPLFSGIQEMLRLSNTTAFRSVGASLSDPYQEYYPPCNSLPYPSEEYWICRLKHYMNTLFHPTSTCRMGKNNDDTAVVDPQLRCFSVFIPILKKK